MNVSSLKSRLKQLGILVILFFVIKGIITTSLIILAFSQIPAAIEIFGFSSLFSD